MPVISPAEVSVLRLHLEAPAQSATDAPRDLLAEARSIVLDTRMPGRLTRVSPERAHVLAMDAYYQEQIASLAKQIRDLRQCVETRDQLLHVLTDGTVGHEQKA